MQLKRVVDALHGEFSNQIAFVMLDITSMEGQQFAARVGVQETTLVFFDRFGMVIDRKYGVPTIDVLRAIIHGNFRF